MNRVIEPQWIVAIRSLSHDELFHTTVIYMDEILIVALLEQERAVRDTGAYPDR
jgi:hypothetical protein